MRLAPEILLHLSTTVYPTLSEFQRAVTMYDNQLQRTAALSFPLREGKRQRYVSPTEPIVPAPPAPIYPPRPPLVHAPVSVSVSPQRDQRQYQPPRRDFQGPARGGFIPPVAPRPVAPPQMRVPTMTCGRCHESDHQSSECFRTGMICYSCGGRGHRAVYCLQRQTGIAPPVFAPAPQLRLPAPPQFPLLDYAP